MAARIKADVEFEVFGDGSATSFVLNLLTGPYRVVINSDTYIPVAAIAKALMPVAAMALSGAANAILDPLGTSVTVTFNTPPVAGAVVTVRVGLLF